MERLRSALGGIIDVEKRTSEQTVHLVLEGGTEYPGDKDYAIDCMFRETTYRLVIGGSSRTLHSKRVFDMSDPRFNFDLPI